MKRNYALPLVAALVSTTLGFVRMAAAQPTWAGYAGNAQHTAISSVQSQSLDRIIWQTPVDLDPQYSNGDDLLIHYGSPLVSAGNTILVPVKTGATDGFRVEARSGADGALLWQFNSDYSLPSHNWVPSYQPTLTTTGRLYLPGAGGTLYYRDNVDSAAGSFTQLAFYGLDNYNANQAAFNSGIKICTPLTSDAEGNVYFGYRTGTNPLSIQSGIARIDADGTMSFVSATTATGGQMSRVAMNVAPALSNDGKTLYFAANNGSFGAGNLVALNAETLATQSQIRVKDPDSGNDAIIPDDGTASPTIGTDGKVYFGVLGNPFGSARGWMLQFDANLSQTLTPGSFGWDDTASLIPASMVPSYLGSSDYLILTKYNNYAGIGGDGINKMAILDPNDTQIDDRTGATVMKEILTIAGVTPDEDFPGVPGAVREWCINTAVVDPFTNSVLVNNEDGKIYRWDLTTNTFTQSVVLTEGIGEAYTPTLIGRDGKIYAINNAILFALGASVTSPEPGSLFLLITGGGILLGLHRSRRNGSK